MDSDNVFGLVFHECAHASHYEQVGRYYWVQYINYIITYGSYGSGTGQNAGYCGVGEMWGNYFGNFRLSLDEFGSSNNWLDGEDWFNPGFLRRVDNISDVTTAEIFSCLTSSTTTIDKLVSTIKTKTENVTQVENAYNSYNDWP